MSVEIISNTIEEPLRRRMTEDAVRRGIGDREGHYQVRIDGSPASKPWLIVVEGPEGVFERVLREPYMKDRNFIRIYFDRAIPRRSVSSVKPMCDVCVRNGLPNTMTPTVDNLFWCEADERSWTSSAGYGNLAAPTRGWFRPRCNRCENEGLVNYVYVEFADGPSDVRYRCPVCHHWERSSLDVQDNMARGATGGI